MSYFTVSFYLVLCSALQIVVSVEPDCDKTRCPGPLAYYESLGCTPKYTNEGDCCASEFDCNHLKERSTDKCYVNGHVYEIGDQLREEDANPCDIGCSCREGFAKVATFTCAVVDCFARPEPGCYMEHSHDKCCSGPQICPKSENSLARCEVDGKTYLKGQYFSAKEDPDLQCICSEGYKGQNVAPFCQKPKRDYCSPELHSAFEIHNNCPPVYYSNQDVRTSCALSHRCQNERDQIVATTSESKTTTSGESDSAGTCRFGNMTMTRGQELNQATDYSSVCVKCVCEVPPLPTCQQLPDEKCDVTNHPPFQNFS